ncbi:MAG: RNA methyltransferase [Rhodospirillaceae bacterium]|nr:RNA methyltransferase [Rhodospirillaceae bacterium]
MTKSPNAPLKQEKGRLQVKVARNAPCVILMEPRLAENMGTTARAMRNCGLSELRLVDPKADWLSEKAIAASSGGAVILEKAKRFDTLEEAIADLQRIYATTARRREMVKPIFTAKGAGPDMRGHAEAGRKMGLLFGREKHGLTSDEIALCDAIIEIPMNPDYSSLNLAQAVLLVSYEWFQAGYEGPQSAMTFNRTSPATKDQVMELFLHLERELVECGFLRDEDKRALMVINIRNMLQRAELTDQEVRTFHGIIKELRYGRRPDRPLRQPGVKPEPAPKPLIQRYKEAKTGS